MESRLRCVRIAVAAAILTSAAVAQPVRIRTSVESHDRVRLACCQAARLADADLGAVESDFPLDDLTVVFRPSAAQQADLDSLLADLQNPRSPSYRRWLTPEQFADRFGVAQADIAAVSQWLRAEGFTVSEPARGRMWLRFRGRASLAKSAFGAEIHRYRRNGIVGYANRTAVEIPAALAGLVATIEGLESLSQHRSGATAQYNLSGGTHALAPGDLATIYNFRPVLDSGIDGRGQKIVVVGATALDMADIRLYRSRFGLPASDPQLVLVPNTPDPGILSGYITEADLDIEVAGAAAPGADIVYVYSSSVLTATRYAIDQKLAPVLTSSYTYYTCEDYLLGEGIATAQSFQTLAQQAAALGITYLNASGDGGATGCDANGSAISQRGLAVRLPGSVPEVVAVGGTELAEDLGSGTYWATANGITGGSATGYIPERVWNSAVRRTDNVAGLGGVSKIFAKPAWQQGDGKFRTVPDLALAAAADHDGYYVISGGRAYLVGGTSASAPLFAGIVALLNQSASAKGATRGLGNINPLLYQIAQSNPSAFHDIVSGHNRMPCSAGSPDCVEGWAGYDAGQGYDLTTGLGSPDVAALLAAWPAGPPAQSNVVVSVSPNPAYQNPTAANQWSYQFVLAEENGVETTVTGVVVNGGALGRDTILSWFGTQSLPAFGRLIANIGLSGPTPPASRSYVFTGVDANGVEWRREITLRLNGPLQTPTIGGFSNAASGQAAYAPGMILSVYGGLLASGTQQTAALPLATFLGGFKASVNGYTAPIYFVSPGQVNIQIPYEVKPGAATLQVSNGQKTVSSVLQIAASAPGVFVDSSGSPVPYKQGKRGEVLILFITGDGAVSPSLATGATPPPTTPVASLPAPTLPVKLTIGGVEAKILFKGIPSGLAGVTQINFEVPANAPTGAQPLVVTVGTAASVPVNFTVLP